MPCVTVLHCFTNGPDPWAERPALCLDFLPKLDAPPNAQTLDSALRRRLRQEPTATPMEDWRWPYPVTPTLYAHFSLCFNFFDELMQNRYESCDVIISL
jgi:hypothetical protein